MNISLILIPIDFSDCAKSALRYAQKIAPIWNAKLALIHVVDSRVAHRIADYNKEPVEKVRERMTNQAQQKFRKFLKEDNNSDYVQDTLVSYGPPFQEIAVKARELEADILLMGGYGSQGSGQIDEIFFGSTVEKVVRLLPCPVFCVPIGWDEML